MKNKISDTSKTKHCDKKLIFFPGAERWEPQHVCKVRLNKSIFIKIVFFLGSIIFLYHSLSHPLKIDNKYTISLTLWLNNKLIKILIYWLVYTPFLIIIFKYIWSLVMFFLKKRYSFWTTQKIHSNNMRIHVPTRINEIVSFIEISVLFLIVFWPSWLAILQQNIKFFFLVSIILLIPNIFLLAILEDMFDE